MGDIFSSIKESVMRRIEPAKETGEEELYEIIDGAIKECTAGVMLSAGNKALYRRKIFNDIKRLDILQELIEDDGITEIMINGWERIFIERDGRISLWDKHFESPKRLTDIVQRIAAASNKIVNEAVPISDTRLADGSRVNIVMNPIAINGPIVTIRKFYDTPLSMERMIELGSLSRETADFLQKLVAAKYNIFISGGTGSGKTTFLNALSNYIPRDERVITIEDSAELKLSDIDNLVRLEARSANIEGGNEITIRALIKSALRMRPDRIIVGEVRGSEAVDMLQAMNTGHAGSLSTGHANGPEDMMLRLETMVLMGLDMPVAAIRGQIASAIDIVVHLGRLRDRTRRVLSINEITGIENGAVKLNCLYEFREEGVDEKNRIIGTLMPTGNIFCGTKKLREAGLACEIGG
ncbi:MAG: CpaF family protein [Butyrivibrio sp.]|nr:CpaF family protein [Butyrivibrio sp.]